MSSHFRLVVGGFQHETNAFAPAKAAFEDFTRPGAWPGLTRGGPLLGPAFRPVRSAQS
jgi:microcystin degradation protein MlrC